MSVWQWQEVQKMLSGRMMGMLRGLMSLRHIHFDTVISQWYFAAYGAYRSPWHALIFQQL
jgi:hypothetical protein